MMKIDHIEVVERVTGGLSTYTVSVIFYPTENGKEETEQTKEAANKLAKFISEGLRNAYS